MKEESNDIFGGFQQVFENLSVDSRPASKEEDESSIELEDPSIIPEPENNPEIIEVEPEELEELEEGLVEEEVIEEEEVEEIEEEPVEPVEEEEVEDLEDATEEEIVDTFFDLFQKELGWDMDEDNTPKNIKDLVSFMDEIIANASQPAYHSEEVKQLDEYVKNGGDLKEFYKATKSGVDTTSLDLSKENNQKAVLKEYLQVMNHSDSYIERKVNRYEESGVLEEEAEDALELLTEYNTKKEQKLLKDQEKQREVQVKQQQKFVGDVEDTIEKSDTILGVKLNTTQKKELLDYLFKVDASGRTEYHKDYVSDPKALVETALLLKEKENLFKKIETKANTDVVKNLRKKIKSNKNKGKQQKAYESRKGSFDMVSAIAGELLST